MMTKSIKFLKWAGISISALIAVAVGIYAYLVISFDDQTLPENHGRVNTELFLGEGDNQPLIVGFGGAEGGNAWASDVWKEQRDAFIAQGYAFLAVAYFGEQGTPENLDRIALEGVHQAIRDAANKPKINGECVALIGGSKGAELALLLGSHYSDIDAVVAIVPGNAVYPGVTIAMNTPSFTLNRENLPFVPMPTSATWPLIKGDLRAVWEEMLKNQKAVDAASIEVEKISGPVFFLSATKDEFWPSTEMSASMVERLEGNGFPYYFEHLAIEGGHNAPLDHFDVVERFLANNFLQGDSSGCSEAP
ncbi:pimeloyl-ACP methyl ester carboxylesterase [Porphyrobacter sp. MBR-155]|jgi:pimeloyl-ACP methyl ester carboxylesterase|uniref:acyl-CoA thioester hydrolase/BAAT C-terminal domain-containing protein n=1 Tax=Porphyrobacter sp. MBR-155 TaxID=3156464 RepID=UPI003399B231